MALLFYAILMKAPFRKQRHFIKKTTKLRTNKKKTSGFDFHALNLLSEVYDRCLHGIASEQEKAIAEKSSAIIRKGNLPGLDTGTRSRINKETYQTLLSLIQQQKRKRKARRILLVGISVAAAIASVFLFNKTLLVSLQQILNSNTEATVIVAGNKDMKQLTLIDGTKISINQNSSIKYYKARYDKSKREIWLNGEAFFDVAKDPKRPFIVHSGEFSVKVLGTAFNIKSYPNLHKYSVSVSRGKVQVNKGHAHLGTLTKDKELDYAIETNTFEISDKDCSEIDKWTSGSLVLSNADASELAFRMKQYYGIKVDIAGNALSGVMINGVYDKTDTPETVIRSICLLYNTKYTCQNGVIRVSPAN